MATIASPAACIAAVAALLLSGIGVGLPIDSASADANCARAPAAAAPAGQHWYYRFDRMKQRKCWYLHTVLALSHRAAKYDAASSEPAPSEPVASEPAASVAAPPAPVAAAPQSAFAAAPQIPFAAPPQAADAAPAPQLAAQPPSEVVSTQPAPHVTVLAIRPVAAPFVGVASTSQAATPEQTVEPPTQITPDSANRPVDAVAKPAAGANSASVPDASATGRLASASADVVAAAAARTHLANVLLLLALALGIAAALIALCGKMAGRARAPRRSGHRGDVWRRDIHEDDAPFLVPRQPNGPAGMAAHERIEQSPPARANTPAPRRRGEEPRRSEQPPNLKDIELALRALRQARQSLAQT